MTTKEMQELASGWKLDSEPALLAFSDYLLERDEVRWAQLVRWFQVYVKNEGSRIWTADFNIWMYHRTGDGYFNACNMTDYTKSPCFWGNGSNDWYGYAKYHRWEIMPDFLKNLATIT